MPPKSHDDRACPQPALPIGRYRFLFEEKTPARLPEYAGSTWRGALGHALRRLVCVTGAPVCHGCPLLPGCVYPNFFETPAPPGTGPLHIQGALPHPFVLVPSDRDLQGRHAVEFTLFGNGNRVLAYVVEAMRRAAAEGIGAGCGIMRLAEVLQENIPGAEQWISIWTPGTRLTPHPPAVPVCPAPPPEVRLQLLTPLRLRADQRNITPSSLQFSDLFSHLLRRISLLMRVHSGTPLQADFLALTTRARTVPLARRDLRWYDWQRYSNRQKTKIPMGGIVGELAIEQPHPDFWPYLWLGQWTHAGKGASMGLGRYRIL